MAKKKNSLREWFGQNDGKGWVDCNTKGPCGRKKGEKRKKYPACRPTLAQCNDNKNKKASYKNKVTFKSNMNFKQYSKCIEKIKDYIIEVEKKL